MILGLSYGSFGVVDLDVALAFDGRFADETNLTEEPLVRGQFIAVLIDVDGSAGRVREDQAGSGRLLR